MVRRAALSALLAAAGGVPRGLPSGASFTEDLALAADNECAAGVQPEPWGVDWSIGHEPPACAVSALQFSGQRTARGTQAVSSSHGNLQNSVLIDRGEEGSQDAFEHKEGSLNDPQLEAIGSGPVTVEVLQDVQRRRAKIEARLGTPLDDLMLGLLKDKLPDINEALQGSLPGVKEDAYNTTLEKRVCCMPSPWGCWCHCSLEGTFHLSNLSNADTLTIRSVTNVTSRIAESLYTVHVEGGLTDVGCAGTATGEATSCAVGPITVHGGLSFVASLNVSAAITGRMLPAPGDASGLCFKITDVELDVPGSGVEYKRIVVKWGDWRLLHATSHFWVHLVNAMPTNILGKSIVKYGQPALVDAVRQEDLCIG